MANSMNYMQNWNPGFDMSNAAELQGSFQIFQTFSFRFIINNRAFHAGYGDGLNAALYYNGGVDPKYYADPSQGYGNYYVDPTAQQASNYAYSSDGIMPANFEAADPYGFAANGSESIGYGQPMYYQGSQIAGDYSNFAVGSNYQQGNQIVLNFLPNQQLTCPIETFDSNRSLESK